MEGNLWSPVEKQRAHRSKVVRTDEACAVQAG